MDAPTSSTRLQRNCQRTSPLLEDWEQFQPGERLMPGHYWTFDIEGAREALLQQGICPRVHKPDVSRVSGLCYARSHIHAVPEELPEIRMFLDRLPTDVPYRGEGIPRLSYMALLALLRPRRRQPSKDEKLKIMELQERRCAMCGDIFRKGITPESTI